MKKTNSGYDYDEWLYYPKFPGRQTKNLPAYVIEYGEGREGKNKRPKMIFSSDYLLNYTISGCGYIINNGKETAITPGCMTLVDRSAEYNMYTGDSEWEHIWMVFGGDGVRGYYNIITDRSNVLYVGKESHSAKKFYDLRFYLESEEFYMDVRNSSRMISLLAEMAEARLREESEELTFVQNTIEYMQAHLDEKISVEELAKKEYMSKFHFLRMFKESMGISPYGYLISLRMKRARELLRGSEKTVAEISKEVGYGDEKSFIRKFKEEFGVTPMQYRNSVF